MKILEQLSKYKFSRYFQILFILWDVILLNTAVIISGLIKFESLDRLFLKEVQTISLLENLIWLGLFII
ncbi:hypothetical protein [Flavobacterium sp. SORGH_AS_0622]|uniref:hypothetical protein n=1 Tax=Flavobacterium sp. SORGH_AS_0622 TaxID=3041772 RepID=UPI0027898515|nr:hypothetical protein [Flavobacterium sp. SORGH_AS_0622]MDQ1167125.1 hypothetical protein [Flavobacterium sp. SORGH_AS_0622]